MAADAFNPPAVEPRPKCIRFGDPVFLSMIPSGTKCDFTHTHTRSFLSLPLAPPLSLYTLERLRLSGLGSPPPSLTQEHYGV